jgi:hypothetical protein
MRAVHVGPLHDFLPHYHAANRHACFVTMCLCKFCMSCEPNKASNGRLYLPDRSLLVQNAARGCGGCRSFRDLLEKTLSPGLELDDNCRAFLKIDANDSSGYGGILPIANQVKSIFSNRLVSNRRYGIWGSYSGAMSSNGSVLGRRVSIPQMP